MKIWKDESTGGWGGNEGPHFSCLTEPWCLVFSFQVVHQPPGVSQGPLWLEDDAGRIQEGPGDQGGLQPGQPTPTSLS